MSKQVTIDVFKKALPKSVRHNLTQKMVDDINQVMTKPEVSEHFRDNLLGYTSVLKDGRFTMKHYINAVRYVSFKLMDASNDEAYAKTFPERYQELLDQDIDPRSLSGYVSAYNKRLLVQKIFEQTMIPVHIFNADLYQKAINAQAYLMINAKSEMAQTQAANSLLTHLKPPETSKVELDITLKEDQVISDLKNTIAELSLVQKKQIESGVTTPKMVAHSKLKIIDVEAEEV